GVERMTMDLDVAIDMTESNLNRFLRAMKHLHLVPRAPVPAESLLDPEKRKIMIEEKNALVFTFIDPKNPYRQVDVFLTDKLSYDTLKENVEHVDIGSHRAKLVSKKTLLQMKKAVQPPREKDIFDIHILEKIISKSEDTA
ncbi:MAG TPA: hypothetical protein PLG31_08695, partial [Spirochaetota bacterium]|nr:hypothetical protein [Spirochaetota bacterium]